MEECGCSCNDYKFPGGSIHKAVLRGKSNIKKSFHPNLQSLLLKSAVYMSKFAIKRNSGTELQEQLIKQSRV